MLQIDIYNIFFSLLTFLVKIILLLPIILYFIGIKIDSIFLKKIALKLILLGIFLSLILTINYYLK